MSSLVLQVIPVNSSGSPVGEVPFVRSGLLGFVGPVREALWSLRCSGLQCFREKLLGREDVREELAGSSSQVPSCLAGQFGVCGWENGRIADSERAKAQRRRHCGHWTGRGVNKNSLQRKVSTRNLVPPHKLLHVIK